MKLHASGKIHERIHVAATLAYPAYIIKGDSNNAMIEGGLNLLGPLYMKSIDEILGDRNRLEYIFITHSHYDHLGAVQYIKRHIPGVRVAAHERVGSLLNKE